MALTVKDCHLLINMIAQQATGQTQLTPTDTSGFVSLGEKIMETGTDNVFKAISVVMGRLFVAVRPYNDKLKIIDEMSTGAFTARMRKVSFYNDATQAAGNWNTDLYSENLKDGAENTSATHAVGSQWEQNLSKPVEISFYSHDVWDASMTLTEKQVKAAFRDEESFALFWEGQRLQKQNEINLARESFRRMQLLNALSSRYAAAKAVPALKTQAINLTAGFNKEFGTTYTSAQLRSTYLRDFLAYMVTTIKQTYDNMQEYSAYYHNPIKKGNDLILRQTPRERAKLILYKPLFTKSEAMVLPEVFNDQYLKPENYEPVNYWQVFDADPEKRALINTNCIYKDADWADQSGAATNVYIVGFLFDDDALKTNMMLDSAAPTPMEARKEYRNIWWHFSRGAINDLSENGVVFYMEDAPGK